MVTKAACQFLTASGLSSLVSKFDPPRSAVLMCHSIGRPSKRHFSPNAKWTISPNQLDQTITIAKDLGYELASMEELIDDFTSPKGQPPKLVLTFDDGYADNLQEALPVCRKHNLPMLVYVTSGFVERTHIAWWHFLEQLIFSESHISIPSRQLDFPTKTTIQKQVCFDQLANMFRNASAHHQRQILEEMSTRYGYQAVDYAKDLFLDHSALKTLAAHKLVSIGVHGVSHAASAFLSDSDFQSEFSQCRDFLEDETSKKIKHSAYPFGSSETVSPENFRLTQSLGFDSATTTEHGCVVQKTKNLFALPRIPVFPEDTKHSIACKLSGVTTVVNAVRRKNLMSRSAVSSAMLLSD